MTFLILVGIVAIIIVSAVCIAAYLQNKTISLITLARYLLPCAVFACYFYALHRGLLIQWLNIERIENEVLLGVYYVLLDILLIIGFILEIQWGKPHPQLPEIWKMLWGFLVALTTLFVAMGSFAVYFASDAFLAQWAPAFVIAKTSFPYIFLSLTLIAVYVQRRRIQVMK